MIRCFNLPLELTQGYVVELCMNPKHILLVWLGKLQFVLCLLLCFITNAVLKRNQKTLALSVLFHLFCQLFGFTYQEVMPQTEHGSNFMNYSFICLTLPKKLRKNYHGLSMHHYFHELRWIEGNYSSPFSNYQTDKSPLCILFIVWLV